MLPGRGEAVIVNYGHGGDPPVVSTQATRQIRVRQVLNVRGPRLERGSGNLDHGSRAQARHRRRAWPADYLGDRADRAEPIPEFLLSSTVATITLIAGGVGASVLWFPLRASSARS